MAWLADDLLSRVKVRCQMPDSNGAITDAELRAIADEDILTEFVPRLRRSRQAWQVHSADQTIVASTAGYRIPARAQAGGLHDVILVDAAGDELSLHEISPLEIWRQEGQPSYAIEGDLVTIVPTPTSAGETLRLKFYLRPPALIAASAAGQITGIAGLVVTCANVPTSWTTSNIFDLHQGRGNFAALAIDRAITARVTGASGTLTFSAALPSDLAVGDYVALAEQTPVVPLPDIMQHALVYAVSCSALEAIGDPIGRLAWCRERLAGKMQEIDAMLAPRATGEPKRIVNRYSPLRCGRGYR